MTDNVHRRKNTVCAKTRKKINENIDSSGLCVKITGDFVPEYQSDLAAGCDLYAANDKDIIIRPRAFGTVPTGIHIEIPEGYEAQVRPRSGLAKDNGIGVLNSPGTIDADYRGEIKVILFNYGDKPFKIKKRDRIAQLVFSRVEQAKFVRVKRLNRTKRQNGGLGHTGI
ncbi:MAG: dUTP diphosphatase [candidate division WOR-3 bacterium]|nr:MAG: dUTP diphosphatase [candidate division WOR-3 bacterium]